MYLEAWMIIAIILAFGVCAFYNRRGGFVSGATVTLAVLEKERMIKIAEDGSVRRWTACDEKPAPKKRKRSRRTIF